MRKRDIIMNKNIHTELLMLVSVVAMGMIVCILPVIAQATVVSIGNATVNHGETVTVPINITDVDVIAIADIRLFYNKDVVIVDNISEGDLRPLTTGINNTAGVVRMNWFSVTGNTGDIVFAYVTLKAVGSASQNSSLGLKVKVLTDTSTKSIVHTVKNGTFTTLSEFDTGESTNPYPSIFGTHKGTIKPNQTTKVQNFYTYPCVGTGGHTVSVRIYGKEIDKSAFWKGYGDDRHTITFDSSFSLEGGETYSYIIETGSYPQIHHASSLLTDNGWINCTEFVDANGRKNYNNWIPAIKLE